MESTHNSLSILIPGAPTDHFFPQIAKDPCFCNIGLQPELFISSQKLLFLAEEEAILGELASDVQHEKEVASHLGTYLVGDKANPFQFPGRL